MQPKSGEGVVGTSQSHTGQKLQSICAQESRVVICARQAAAQSGFTTHTSPTYWT